MGKEPEDKVFISETTSNVNCTVNGLQESSVAVVVPESQVERAAGVAVIGRVGCDKAKDRVDCDEKPKKVTVVQVGSLSVDKKPNKLSANQLRNFQSRPNSESKLVVPLSVIVSDNKDEDQDLLILSTSIGATELSSKMISMMTTIGSNSPNSTSSKNSECDTFTLDSGTCSDLEVNSSSSLNSITPPPLPKKMSSKGKQEKLKSSDFDENEKFLQLKSSFHHLNDQEDNMSVISCGSNNSNCSSISLISCDSLNQHNNIIGKSLLRHGSLSPPQISAEIMQKSSPASGTLILNVNGEDQVDDNGIASLVISGKKTVLPTSLLADIRSRSQSLQSNNGHQLNGSRQNGPEAIAASEKFITKKLINFSMNSMDGEANSNRFSTANPYQDQGADTGHFYRNGHNKINSNHKLTKAAEQPRKSLSFENDNYYNFHINENQFNYLVNSGKSDKCIFDTNEETFAGYKDLSGTISSGSSTIRSNKGTIRGVKNRVRNGIATFLQMQHTNVKSYKEKDAGKVVLYASSMGIVRETYAKCANVKQILRTLLVKFEERDVFMSSDYQQEIKDRMQSNEIKVPQLYVDGQYIGDAECVERLNESGELRKMLKAYKCMDPSYTCQACGGYRLLPCPSCSGSKKSVHRNHFTTEFIALKCMNCDEVGLVRCHNC